MDIKTDKIINKEVGFETWMQNFCGDQWMLKSYESNGGDSDYHYPNLYPAGKFKVILCVDYIHPEPLQFAYKYANKFKTEYNISLCL